MFAKIFEQIYDSSISEDWQVRVVFEDLLVLADIDGVVDRTHEAISRRTNVPIDIIKRAIAYLEQPDQASRKKDADGRRIIRLDEHRDWGWFIVNYQYYRGLASEEQRREKTRVRVNKYRDNLKCNAPVTLCNDFPSASASTSSSQKGGVGEIPESLKTPEFLNAWENWVGHRIELKKRLTPRSVKMQMKEFEGWGVARSIAAIEHTIKMGWQGIREPNQAQSMAAPAIQRKPFPGELHKTLAELRSQRDLFWSRYATMGSHGTEVMPPEHQAEWQKIKERVKDAEKQL